MINDMPRSIIIAVQYVNHITVVVALLRKLLMRKPLGIQKKMSEAFSAFFRNGEWARILNASKATRNMPHAKLNHDAAE